MRLRSFQAVVFDLDDTLFLERDYARSGFRAVGDYLHGHCDWTWPACRQFVIACNELFNAGRRGDIFDAALRRNCGGRCTPCIADLVAAYRGHFPDVELCPDAHQLLGELSTHANVWIITDGPLVSQCAKIAALRLSRRVRQILCTDRWGREYWKPHARAFEWVQRCSGAAPGSCVYIGDNPSKDFDTPRRLGWSTVRIRRHGGLHAAQSLPTERAPDLELPSLWSFCQTSVPQRISA